MPKPSSDSVRVFFADKDRVLAAAKRASADLARGRPEIERVILFGSYARDDYGPHSDLDLLIVLDHADKPPRDRIDDYLDMDLPCPFDVFPFTRAEIEKRLAEGDPFLKTALDQGIQIFPSDQPELSSPPKTGGAPP